MTDWIAVLIAFGIVLVGYGQWRTANHRVVLDLFERRTKVYARLESAILTVLREGAVDNATFDEFAIACADARFLFGSDAMTYLQRVYEDLAVMKVHTQDVINAMPEPADAIDKKYAALTRISQFPVEAPAVFGPYMAMTQKNTPFWRPW